MEDQQTKLLTDHIVNDLVTSFIHIPYEILLYEIFPHLSIKTINALCPVNSLFNDLCNDEILWEIKINKEYPSLIYQKPSDFSWRDYYKSLITKTVPVYYHGDNIFMITFVTDDIQSVVDSVVKNINHDQNSTMQIAFINSDKKLVIGAQFPNMIIKHFYPENMEISKIILIDNSPLDLSNTERKSRGRKRNNTSSAKIKKIFISNEDIISKELTSFFGNPPIYGTYVNDVFYIIDRTNKTDLRIVSRKRTCDMSTLSELQQLLLKILPNIGDVSIYSRNDLCKLLENAIIDIGHII